METVTTVQELRDRISGARKAGKRIGFVPTMGALHAGHLSLVGIAREQSEIVVMSIFVNPLQFNSPDDYSHYPRTLEEDLRLAKGKNVDLMFLPSEEDLYGDIELRAGSSRVRAGSRAEGLCGAARPGHFDGVVTVVSILFNLVQPDVAVFGEKDFQQLRVIEQLTADLQFPVKIIPGPTVRDADQLALSSRNLRLTAEQRFSALYIPQSLAKAQDIVQSGERSVTKLIQITADNLEKPGGLRVDYIAVVDSETLAPLSVIDRPARMLIAAFAGPVRLIDNIALNPHG